MTFTVSELNEYVGLLLAGDPNLADVRVSGEISGFKRHTSGHLYFSLKDENALVRCVMFRQQAVRLAFSPQDGMQVLLTVGRRSTPRTPFALRAACERAARELFRRFLALKEELRKRGWFDAERKREIPYLPRRVGVVTRARQAQRGRYHRQHHPAALSAHARRARAGLKCRARRRSRSRRAIRLMNEQNAADVLIVGRGGGSIEDLWAFNEPVVAEAVVNSRIRSSAVGHETDFTIADFAADLRRRRR